MEEDERWRMRGYELGDWHYSAVRLLRSKRFKRLAKGFASTSVAIVRDGPRTAIYAVHGAAVHWRGRHASRPSAGSLLRAAGLDRAPSSCTTRAASLRSPRTAASGTTRNGTSPSDRCSGVDLVPTADGFWYLESNLNAAIRPARTALYGDDDPFVVNLSRFAQERGYRRLVLVSPNVLTFDKVAAGRFERECALGRSS
jgi:hypothetical protein